MGGGAQGGVGDVEKREERERRADWKGEFEKEQEDKQRGTGEENGGGKKAANLCEPLPPWGLFILKIELSTSGL